MESTTNRRRLLSLLPLLLALVGCVAMATLVARYNSGVRWQYQLDRATAISRARAAAARNGIDAADWLPRVNASYNSPTDYYLSNHPRRAGTHLLTPVKTSVMLVEPTQRKLSYSVDLTNAGEVTAYEISDAATPDAAKPDAARPDAQPSPDADAGASARAAQAALEGLVGPDEAREFGLVSEVKEASKGTSYTWERAMPPEADLKLRVTCLVRGGSVRKIEPTSSFAPRFLERYDESRATYKVIELFTVSFIILIPFVTLAFCLLGWARRELDWRTVLALSGAVYLLALVLSVFNGGLDDFLMGLNGESVNRKVLIIGMVINFLVVPFFYTLGIVMVWGAGRIYARRAHMPGVASFGALLRGRLFSRGVARPVAAGILFGLFLCAIPYLVAACGLFGRLQLEGPLTGSLVSRAPAVVALIRPIDYGMFVLYGFLVPLALCYTRSPRLVRALALALGCLLMLSENVYRSSAWGALLIAALVILTLDQIVRRYDLLTLVVALLASDAARAAWSLVVMPPTTLRASGMRAFAGLGALLAGALVLSWKGAGAFELEDEAEANQASEEAERDRLRAEFNVAREAQQRMLPANPPRVTGYEISAMCRPAREVGGDLYDFLSLPDERIGFVVADVSGKGVPAALYMTLTKGLLASVAENESDPARILREVNRHLYEVCRRKVFVTMILGVLDAPTRTLTYARAGHNPGIWHSSRTRTATWLRAHGLGLGLNKGALFDKSLQLESIKFESGDSLVFYSDGITEAMNAAGEEYGDERLMAAVARADGLSAEQTQNAIVEDVVGFLDGVAPQDDMTLVVLRVAQD